MFRSWSKRSCTPRTQSTRLAVEQLEDRLVPATFLGTLPNDLVATKPVEQLGARALQAAPAILQSVLAQDNTTLVLRFSKRLGRGKAEPESYQIAGLSVLGVAVSQDRRTVVLTTSTQTATEYLISFQGLFTRGGAKLNTPANVQSWMGVPLDVTQPTTPPRVVGAIATSNTTVLVSFSEAMDDSALNPLHYSVVQDNVNPEAGTLRVLSVQFPNGDRATVELTTASQNELAYTVSAVNVRDLAGTPLAPAVLAGGQRIDPTRAGFHGKPPSGELLLDSDGDGLTDNEEQRGYLVTFTTINGTVVTRGVSSNPSLADSDGDGLSDAQEAALRLDPRDADTDDDMLTDFQEFNELFSNPLSQDSDGDTLDDGLEFFFFRTSVVHADTDGDQLPDGQEVLLANRNARVADLPAPAIEIGGVNLQLDVRFTETTSTQTRDLETRTVASTLTQSERQENSNSHSATIEAEQKLTVETGFEVGVGGLSSAFGSAKFNASSKIETSASGSWTGSWTEATARESQEQFQRSLETQAELTEGATLERTVNGARMQVTLFLKNAGNLAYRIRNLQVTAAIQDPNDPTSLIPLATLLPDSEPAEGFTLGPLVPDRGPLVLSSDAVFPALVESLMANPRGLIFRLSNYDIIDEAGRHFAFTARDVIDRTGSVAIDFGGYDSNNDGEGDLTEYHRVATSAGREINGQRVVFDANGRQVGITLREALTAVGLTHYEEQTTPTASLTEEQRRNSYSTFFTDEGFERIHRIRDTALEEGLRKAWEIITPTGIDRTIGLDDLILRTDSDVKLAFVQDLDGDRLPATLEYLYGTSDERADTDGDGLDDRFETLIGWQVEIAGRGSFQVLSAPTLADSDGDGLTDAQEAPGLLELDAQGLIVRASRADSDDYITDPLRPDSDRDGIPDFTEVTGFAIIPRGSTTPLVVVTDPANPDTDGDTAPDGVELRLQGNPIDPGDFDLFADNDRDGLTNLQETEGWSVTTFQVSLSAGTQGLAQTLLVTSDPNDADSDDDGILDGVEFSLLTNPRSVDTDQDGLTDFQEVRGFQVRDLGFIVLDPLDADSDNDKLSDGAEAELVDVEANRWIVRVEGADPYRVSSDPRFADADFDGLVDGDERTQGSDPTKANTDGDGRNDLEEFGFSNPLREDFRVTVLWESLYIEHDGDLNGNSGFPDFEEINNPGEFRFNLWVRKPSASSPTGLGARETILTQTAFDSPEVQISGGNTLFFGNTLDETQRSLSFSVAPNERFAIEAQVTEIDRDGDDILSRIFVNLGGLSGLRVETDQGTRLPVWEGATLTPGLLAVTFKWEDGDTLNNFGNDDQEIQGELRGYIIVD